MIAAVIAALVVITIGGSWAANWYFPSRDLESAEGQLDISVGDPGPMDWHKVHLRDLADCDEVGVGYSENLVVDMTPNGDLPHPAKILLCLSGERKLTMVISPIDIANKICKDKYSWAFADMHYVILYNDDHGTKGEACRY